MIKARTNNEIEAIHTSTRTPTDPPVEYDWRKEGWVEDGPAPAYGDEMLAQHIAFHVIISMAATGDNPQDEEDERVCAFLLPELTERLMKSAEANEVVRYRLVQAASQGIERIIKAWKEKHHKEAT